MSRKQDCATRGFVDSAGFHAHKPVFHDIDPSDAVLATEGVEDPHDSVGAQKGVAVPLSFRIDVSKPGEQLPLAIALKSHRIPLLKKKLEIERLIGGLLG